MMPSVDLPTGQGIVRVPTGTWRVDRDRSSVEFEVAHRTIANRTVRHRFEEFEGMIEAAGSIRDSRVYFTVMTASIDTSSVEHDAYLSSAEFLDVDRYPELRLESTWIEPEGAPEVRFGADLTIKDVTRDVELEATISGAQFDPWGRERVDVRVRGMLDPAHFGFLAAQEVRVLVDVCAVSA